MSIQSMLKEFPEVRAHLDHLRAMHDQQMGGIPAPHWPRPDIKAVALKQDPADERMVDVKLRLAPEVVDAFKSTGKGWEQRINKVLVKFVRGMLCVE